MSTPKSYYLFNPSVPQADQSATVTSLRRDGYAAWIENDMDHKPCLVTDADRVILHSEGFLEHLTPCPAF